MQSYDEELVKVLQEQNISTSDTCLPHAYATEIEWTYPNIISKLFVISYVQYLSAKKYFKDQHVSCGILFQICIYSPRTLISNRLNIAMDSRSNFEA